MQETGDRSQKTESSEQWAKNVRRCLLRLWLPLLIILVPLSAHGYEFSGELSMEGRFFLGPSAYSEQESQYGSIAIKPEFYHQFESGSSVLFTPFARLDSSDDERTHWDIREASYLHLADQWEITIGISKVFWGATEFVHLVDIINQTDLVESLDDEEKLGQPMAHLSVPRDWGTVDAFVLPWFRERTYPGKHGRLRTPLVVDTEQARYESESGQQHTDFALRYSNTFWDADVGIYQFLGTSRKPTMELGRRGETPVLIPFYQQISQTGLDLQMVAGSWLLKGEAYYRSGQGTSHAATTFGFEYTFVGIIESSMDLGLIGEYVYNDDTDDNVVTPYNNDIMAGVRLAVNDAAGSQLLTGIINDMELSSTFVSVEASRRIGDKFKLALDATLFIDIDENEPAYSLRDDDLVKLELVYYY